MTSRQSRLAPVRELPDGRLGRPARAGPCSTALGPPRTALDVARHALVEARQRGWRVELVNGWPAVSAPMGTGSVPLLDRLREFADVVRTVLREER